MGVVNGMGVEHANQGILSEDPACTGVALGWIARHYRNWNRAAGNNGFVVLNRYRNLVATDPLDAAGLRGWLIDTLRERRRPFYW